CSIVLVNGADFVGSQACFRCHAAIASTYARTPMARSSGKVGTGGFEERFDKPEFRGGAFTYRIEKDSGGYSFEFQDAKQSIKGPRKLEYFVGSGSAARSYLMNDGGFLYEAPVAYYRNLAAWKFAPGFETFDYPYLTRPVLPGCLQCHASGIQHSPRTQNA